MYSADEIRDAVAQIFGIKHGLETMSFIVRTFNRIKNGRVKQYSWSEINESLFSKGWTVKHLATLRTNLK